MLVLTARAVRVSMALTRSVGDEDKEGADLKEESDIQSLNKNIAANSNQSM
jgi:hypothetical protein